MAIPIRNQPIDLRLNEFFIGARLRRQLRSANDAAQAKKQAKNYGKTGHFR
jgi:hypothetical protein